jgi:hypothetical protein
VVEESLGRQFSDKNIQDSHVMTLAIAKDSLGCDYSGRFKHAQRFITHFACAGGLEYGRGMRVDEFHPEADEPYDFTSCHWEMLLSTGQVSDLLDNDLLFRLIRFYKVVDFIQKKAADGNNLNFVPRSSPAETKRMEGSLTLSQKRRLKQKGQRVLGRLKPG